MLPDALADALVMVIADKDREYERMLEVRDAEHKAVISELRAIIAEQQNKLADLARQHEKRIEDALKNIKDGKEGPAGRDGAPGEKGEAGQKGESGRDGLPGLPGRDGKDGAPGKDALGFDAWSVEYDGERNLTFVCGSGERTNKSTITLAHPIYRGVFGPGNYVRGDCVTQNGSAFIARRNTDKEPEGNPDDWALMVKRGKHGIDGKPGAPGPKGDDGRDMVAFGLDAITTAANSARKK